MNDEQKLAQRLSALRVAQDWSLEMLAEKTGISRATLSRIERAETSPTAALLGKLSAAYGLPTSRLLMDLEDNPAELIRHGHQSVWRDTRTGFERRAISPPARDFQAEFMSGRLKAGARIHYDAPPVFGLEQHVWLISGVLELTLDQQQYRLEAGDCLRFHLFGSSTFYVPGPEDAHYSIVICRP
ncbi:helix-turn-helix domain-containing protein [Serratia sp. M24T3]|uniref:Helix-turn-helix domain-containing protein n=1 Tax=Rouxiella sp. WC2420 TaxID=3234145 RepID=A0AB39VN51_9GAMM|nr:XRE family transcriptional regulator [Serratia sp. M24T3]EIC83799.1 helix-turn-helix domain-containing protein [Serratia sp. M24T3]